MGAGLLLVTEADKVQVVTSRLEALSVGETGLQTEAKEDVLQSVQPREERILLEHHEPIATGRMHGLVA